MEENKELLPERVVLKVEKNGRDYIFSMPDKTPIGEAWDVTYQILNHLLELAKQANEQVKPPVEQVEPGVLEVKAEETWQEAANS